MDVMAKAAADIVRPVTWEHTERGRQSLVWKEWIVTNGLGGYASGTLAGALTRRYHALLIAALPAPYGRMVMLNLVWERLRWPDGHTISLTRILATHSGHELDSSQYLTDFRLESGLPIWTYEVDGVRLEKR